MKRRVERRRNKWLENMRVPYCTEFVVIIRLRTLISPRTFWHKMEFECSFVFCVHFGVDIFVCVVHFVRMMRRVDAIILDGWMSPTAAEYFGEMKLCCI